MRTFTDDFFIRFDEGIRRYIEGRWQEAKDWIKESLLHKPQDGPSQVLLHYMKGYGYQAPDSWEGFRIIRVKF